MGISIDISDVLFGFQTFDNYVKERVRLYLQEQSKELVNYMKRTAPWNDRTGNARRGLKAEPYDSGDTVGIRLEHTVDYGVYLEYAMELRFAILEPTARLKGPDVVRGMHGILDRGRL